MRVVVVIVSFVQILFLLGCANSKNPKVLYSSPQFEVFTNKVIQGSNVATVESPVKIHSNYRTSAFQNYARKIDFKFSINEKDDELPVSINHTVVVGNEHESSVLVFGKQNDLVLPDTIGFLPPNYPYTFRVDMTPVLEAFKTNGFYKSADGSVVSKDDFKAFYICGNALPLTWDFSNLDEKGLKLIPTGDGNIYSITLNLNPVDTTLSSDKMWSLSKDISAKPQFISNIPIVDALYNMSVEEALTNIEPDSTFRTGAKWGGVWTRDVSFSIFLAFAYHQPDVAMKCLRKKVKRDRIIQDTGSGGAWPVSSDRVVWAMAAYEIYKVTGDKQWLAYTYQVVKNSIDDDKQVVFDALTGLYRGESSFLDWREQTYPKWMQNADIHASENLGTNVLHFLSLKICAEMAQQLGLNPEPYSSESESLKISINTNLWQADKGFYAQYLYGKDNLTASPRFEALGEALSVLFDVASPEQGKEMYQKSPITAFGVTCIYPQIPGISPYHNNAIWPFVQSYWNLGAAKVKNEAALTQGLASIYRAGALFLTNYENFVATNGDFFGTEINSDHMLWSMAGNIAMVHRVFMGISFDTDRMNFQPIVPEVFKGKKELRNFRYRKAVLDIIVKGYGANISSFKVDGNVQKFHSLPGDLVGKHTISIELDNKSFGGDGINMVDNAFSLPAPVVTFVNGKLTWPPISGVDFYTIYKDGKKLENLKDTYWAVELSGEYKVTAVDGKGWESFSSEPIRHFAPEELVCVEFDDSSLSSFSSSVTGFSAKGFVELSTSKNLEYSFSVEMNEPGDFVADVRYANGSGAWNTDNSCAIRTLYVNGVKSASLVMPQRGTDEWSNWGYSNSSKIHLNKGANAIKIAFMPWDNNMNVDINRALIDQLRLYRVIR